VLLRRRHPELSFVETHPDRRPLAGLQQVADLLEGQTY